MEGAFKRDEFVFMEDVVAVLLLELRTIEKRLTHDVGTSDLQLSIDYNCTAFASSAIYDEPIFDEEPAFDDDGPLFDEDSDDFTIGHHNTSTWSLAALHQPSSVTCADKELVPDPIPAAATSSAIDMDMKSGTTNISAPSTCSTNCLSGFVDVTTSVAECDTIKELVLDPLHARATSTAVGFMPNYSNDTAPWTCSMKCSSNAIDIMMFAAVSTTAKEPSPDSNHVAASPWDIDIEATNFSSNVPTKGSMQCTGDIIEFVATTAMHKSHTTSGLELEIGFLMSATTLSTLQLSLWTSIPTHNILEVMTVSSLALFVNGFSKLLCFSNGRDGRSCKFRKPPWNVCVSSTRSWSEQTQLIVGFLLEPSPCFSNHVMSNKEVLQLRLCPSFRCSETWVFVLWRISRLTPCCARHSVFKGSKFEHFPIDKLCILIIYSLSTMISCSVFTQIRLSCSMPDNAISIGSSDEQQQVGKGPIASSMSTVIQWKQGFSGKLKEIQVPWPAECQEKETLIAKGLGDVW